MSTVIDMIDVLKAFDIKATATKITRDNSGHILSGVKNQLWDGQKPDGSDITPSYLDDPFFKSRKQAEAYANWKMKISKNSRRNKYAPNLFINGYFYNTLKVQTKDTAFEVNSSWNEVGGKYKDALGLSLEHGNEIVDEHIRPQWMEAVEKATGLKFS